MSSKPDSAGDLRLERNLDAMVVGNVLLAFAVVGLLWFLRVAAVPMQLIATIAAVASLIFSAILVLTSGIESVRLRRSLSFSVHLAGVAFLAVCWHFAGGVNNPLFLLLFLPPIFAATRRRWEPFVIAAASTLAVTFVALLESPDLVWYFAEMGLAVDSVLEPFRVLVPPEVFPSSNLSAEGTFASLVLFALVLLGSAVMAFAAMRPAVTAIADVESSLALESLVELQRLGRANEFPLVALSRSGKVIYLNPLAERTLPVRIGDNARAWTNMEERKGSWWIDGEPEQVVTIADQMLVARRLDDPFNNDVSGLFVIILQPQRMPAQSVMFRSLVAPFGRED